jgi:2-oxoglutarate/2-oxoacid ferredoxin oxidoreductase subunit beta
VTYGEEWQQVKAQKALMQPLESLGHDPSDRLKAFDLAQEYTTKLYTGVFYKDPTPPPTYDSLVRERQAALSKDALPRERILDVFVKS